MFLDLILLLDDDEVTNFIHYEYLTERQLAAHIEVFDNVGDALAFARNLPPQYAQDGKQLLALIDINMGGMDGFDFLKRFNALPVRNRFRVYMLSTSTHPKDLDKAREVGVDGYLVKPLAISRLEEVLAKGAEEWRLMEE